MSNQPLLVLDLSKAWSEAAREAAAAARRANKGGGENAGAKETPTTGGEGKTSEAKVAHKEIQESMAELGITRDGENYVFKAVGEADTDDSATFKVKDNGDVEIVEASGEDSSPLGPGVLDGDNMTAGEALYEIDQYKKHLAEWEKRMAAKKEGK